MDGLKGSMATKGKSKQRSERKEVLPLELFFSDDHHGLQPSRRHAPSSRAGGFPSTTPAVRQGHHAIPQKAHHKGARDGIHSGSRDLQKAITYSQGPSHAHPPIRLGSGPLSQRQQSFAHYAGQPKSAFVASPSQIQRHGCANTFSSTFMADGPHSERKNKESHRYGRAHGHGGPLSPPPAYSPRGLTNVPPYKQTDEREPAGDVWQSTKVILEGRPDRNRHHFRPKGSAPTMMGAPARGSFKTTQSLPSRPLTSTTDMYCDHHSGPMKPHEARCKRLNRAELAKVDPAKGQFVFSKQMPRVHFDGKLSYSNAALSDEEDLPEGIVGWGEEEWDVEGWEDAIGVEDSAPTASCGWAENDGEGGMSKKEGDDINDAPRLRIDSIFTEAWKNLFDPAGEPRVKLKQAAFPVLPIEIVEKILVQLASQGSKSAVTALQICKSSNSLLLPFVYRHLVFRSPRKALAFCTSRRIRPLPPATVSSVTFHEVDHTSYRVLDLLKAQFNRPSIVHADGKFLNPNGRDKTFYLTTGTLLSTVQELTVVNYGLGQKWINELVMPSDNEPQDTLPTHDDGPHRINPSVGPEYDQGNGDVATGTTRHIGDVTFSPVALRSVTLYQPSLRRCTIAPAYLPQLERVSLFVTSDGIASDAGIQLLPDIWRCISSGDARMQRRKITTFDVSITFVTHKRWELCCNETYAALVQLQDYLLQSNGRDFVVADTDLSLSFHVARFHSREEALHQVKRHDAEILQWQKRAHRPGAGSVTVHPDVDFTRDQRIIVEDDFHRRLFAPLQMASLSIAG
ncbi:hypothetical protein FA10DRAFT_175179 [Acaromyces ingoldii]|uniref:Uncharacterized protein n=1 Tax=Acaromyces ingoldii TaxID=215250 RepID=A0A316YGI6_9BASI|nr:hypothetical protein FA10DRAFT_175179 [Acaromyces ingoldii]PWN87718.1 hypothetical protein FA10DRAFT_175179 [Acaromyces ingoldii]